MMELEQIHTYQFFTFVAVLVRFSSLFAIIPFVGDKTIPGLVRILLSLAVSVVLYPTFVKTGLVNPSDAAVWSSKAGSLIGTLLIEVLVGLTLAFTARLIFDVITIGGDLIGTFMGLASASLYDPHQETQTAVVAKLQGALAMLLFLAMNGHHLMFQAALHSYQIVPLGGAEIAAGFGEWIVFATAGVIKLGLQLSAPVAICIFSVNLVFGIFSKAIPQINILVMSFSVSAFVGMFVLMVGNSQIQFGTGDVLRQVSTWMETSLVRIKKGGS